MSKKNTPPPTRITQPWEQAQPDLKWERTMLALLFGVAFALGFVHLIPAEPVPVVVDIGEPATILAEIPDTRAPEDVIRSQPEESSREPAKKVGGQDGLPFMKGGQS